MNQNDEPLSDAQESPDVWYKRARGVEYRGDYPAARSICLQAIKELEQAGEIGKLAAAHHFFGNIAYRHSQLDEAERSFRKSLSIDEQTGNRLGTARTLNNLSAVASSRGDYSAAIDYLHTSIRIKEEFADKRGLAASYHQLGVTYANQGDYVSAKRYYEDSLAIDTALGDHVSAARTCLALWIDTKELSNDEEAQLWLDKAMQSVDETSSAKVAFGMAQDAKRRNSLEEAKLLFQKAITFAEHDEDRNALSSCYFCHGAMAAQTRDFDTATRSLKKSMELDTELGVQDRIAQAHRWLD
ncbi:tetratricopeptide repeat protein [Aeoliella sp.]|uniref:tetratricopeptide repeat protein n=1 Tax=Aeoliella sp. TaxID=2795800 RepID=UPI003CCBBFD4